MENFMRIPQPKTYGLLGNIPLIDKDAPTLSFWKIADEYGPIFRFEAFGFIMHFVSSHELIAEVCDESRFDKSLSGGLYFLRSLGGDGLFTSKTKEPNWQKAHNILMPAFSQQAMKGYHTMMVDIASQLVQKWSRLNPNESIDIPDDMTRLTLDTIGLCGFNYRFNSFYRETHNPFIISMIRALDEAMHQSTRLPIQNQLMVRTKRQFEHDIKSMFSLVDKIIAERKEGGDQGETDLLARMLNVKDPLTGERLDDENIRFQIITFLIAGHETTSGLLSFAIYLLLKHPEVLKKAYKEVDQVLVDSIPSYQQVLDLKYIRMILNEALRLYPTAPQFTLYAKEDTVIGGKYRLKKYDNVSVIIPKLHRDKDAWGEDAEAFRPERFADITKIPADAYKPFGNGQRACIGMQFALHEATVVLGMILQHFDLIDHMNYQLKIKQTLTLKPDNFKILVKLRENKRIDTFALSTEKVAAPKNDQEAPKYSLIGVNNRPLLVLYGSNMGTAERVAHKLADIARLHGVRSEAAPLNDRIGKLPTEGAVIIVTSSYNGKPPRNARQFVQWLEHLETGSLKGVQYAVFGCGDHNWANTYQDVPRFIDEQLALKGAVRFSERGEGDAGGDFEEQLEEWKNQMWQDAFKTFGIQVDKRTEKESNTISIQFVNTVMGSPLAGKYDSVQGSIVENQLVFNNENEPTRQIVISLPEGQTYQEGNQLGVFSWNSKETVQQILNRFGLNGKDHVIITASGRSVSHLPLDRPVSLVDLISQSVEVNEAATRTQIRELAAYTVCPPHKRELEALLADGVYEELVLKNRVSMLDLLEKYEACEMPFERFLELLPSLKPSFFSITSSPKESPDRVSISISVDQGDPGQDEVDEQKAAYAFLADSNPGDQIVMFILKSEADHQQIENQQYKIG
ncbi:cytochrome P450 [Bacillus sp. FJAT-49825]|uniref:Cytochrome P450 n=1 Tax=Neobacillus rhizophilus TaxID=2833579 RepID=A0A942U218_9BACI|nr:cytochrome P450 [Neobacillus rhizophilus]